ncbi:elongator complex protein [Xylariaceae sp. FL1272]|nr:elongator complex protein [Xylariaceae sp. FL1272]
MGREKPEIEYLSVGANRQTAVADWSEDGLVAFGADSNIALWRPHDSQPRGITGLLSAHKDTVKALKFLPRIEGDDDKTYLLSGADDHSLNLWSLTSSGDVTCLQCLNEHTAAINCITTVCRAPGVSKEPIVIATGAADASVRIWIFDGTEVRLVQTINLKPKFFSLAIALSELDANDKSEALVMAVAGTRATVQIFVSQSAASPDFQLQATLGGHEGWIRSLDFTWEKIEGDSDLILASASQDKYVRLWRLHRGKDLPATAANGADPSLSAYMPGRSLSNKAHMLKSGEQDYTVTFEALLLGHDDWIYSAKWYTNQDSKKLQLLSTSADNTLAIWEADPDSGIWVTNVRLGEISREKGATTATGSTGGFWTGLWSPDGKSVTCLGRTGSWRIWDYNEERDQWTPRIGISGHTRAVTGISWSGNGEYLLSTSSDQTTRLHASWKRDSAEKNSWHEMARPQIHGYDLNCIDALGDSQFVSGADEKLMRVFDEPKAVARLLNRLAGIDISSNEDGKGIESMPDAANMPVLGLSNKAIDDAEPTREEDGQTVETPEARKSALEIDHPPFEESLSRHTLWPEREKLYGHGYELSCLAVSHDGKLIASACKASSINHAVIRLFETERWTEIRPPLTAHSLTVTRLRFSPDDKYLLSVGRDRQWAIFERDVSKQPTYKLLQSNTKAHSRMILDTAWAPSTSGLVFATGGRDKQVKIWRKESSESQIACVQTIAETHPVTAVDFKPHANKDGNYVLAVGNEAGKISVHYIDLTSLAVSSSVTLGADLCLAKSVLQLAWRPQADSNELAIAGEDNSLRLYLFAE